MCSFDVLNKTWPNVFDRVVTHGFYLFGVEDSFWTRHRHGHRACTIGFCCRSLVFRFVGMIVVLVFVVVIPAPPVVASKAIVVMEGRQRPNVNVEAELVESSLDTLRQRECGEQT